MGLKRDRFAIEIPSQRAGPRNAVRAGRFFTFFSVHKLLVILDKEEGRFRNKIIALELGYFRKNLQW